MTLAITPFVRGALPHHTFSDTLLIPFRDGYLRFRERRSVFKLVPIGSLGTTITPFSFIFPDPTLPLVGTSPGLRQLLPPTNTYYQTSEKCQASSFIGYKCLAGLLHLLADDTPNNF